MLALLLATIPIGPDQDQDGLSDTYEHELAVALAPIWVFDSHETARAPHEPLTLYQVHPILESPRAPSKALSVLLTYAYLFQWDGGYPLSTFCDDSHPGDNPTLKIRIEIEETSPLAPRVRGLRWNGSWIGPTLLQLENGSHPRIYLSAGKHHPSPIRWHEPSYSPFSNWQCRDVNDGLGEAVPAEVERYGVPLNVGEQMHPLITDLTIFGYPNEDAWGNQPFCGGLQSKIGRVACRATHTRKNKDLWQR
jgi:hypothetical protein